MVPIFQSTCTYDESHGFQENHSQSIIRDVIRLRYALFPIYTCFYDLESKWFTRHETNILRMSLTTSMPTNRRPVLLKQFWLDGEASNGEGATSVDSSSRQRGAMSLLGRVPGKHASQTVDLDVELADIPPL